MLAVTMVKQTDSKDNLSNQKCDYHGRHVATIPGMMKLWFRMSSGIALSPSRSCSMPTRTPSQQPIGRELRRASTVIKGSGTSNCQNWQWQVGLH
jgi:hypothetical protein